MLTVNILTVKFQVGLDLLSSVVIVFIVVVKIKSTIIQL